VKLGYRPVLQIDVPEASWPSGEQVISSSGRKKDLQRGTWRQEGRNRPPCSFHRGPGSKSTRTTSSIIPETFLSPQLDLKGLCASSRQPRRRPTTPRLECASSLEPQLQPPSLPTTPTPLNLHQVPTVSGSTSFSHSQTYLPDQLGHDILSSRRRVITRFDQPPPSCQSCRHLSRSPSSLDVVLRRPRHKAVNSGFRLQWHQPLVGLRCSCSASSASPPPQTRRSSTILSSLPDLPATRYISYEYRPLCSPSSPSYHHYWFFTGSLT
jgi:hypothetical protein